MIENQSTSQSWPDGSGSLGGILQDNGNNEVAMVSQILLFISFESMYSDVFSVHCLALGPQKCQQLTIYFLDTFNLKSNLKNVSYSAVPD